MRRFAAVAPAGGRSFAAGFCAEGLFSPGVLRRKIFAADGSRGGSCGFRSYRLSKSGACVGRFASTLPHGTAPPGLRACRDACSGFDAPRSVHRGPCIGAMPAGSCVGRFASTLRTGRPPLPGLRVCRDACSGFGAPRGPCIGARASRTVHRSYAGRFLRRSVRVDASARDGPPPDFVRAGMRVPDSVPREIRESRTVYRRPCGAACVPRTGSEDRLSAASVRRRNAAERTFPFRCGEGSQYDTGDCGDAAHRTGGCPQRSDPVRRRGGAFRGRSDGAKEGPIAIGAVGVWGLPVVARCRPGEVCEQPDSRAVGQNGGRTAGQKGRRPDSFGKRKNADAARSCAGSEPVRRAGSANVGGGRRTSVSPIGKTERKRIWGRAAGAWS